MKLINLAFIFSLILCLFPFGTADARYVRKSESFVFLVDYSKGMQGDSEIFGDEKMQAVKAVLSLINKKIPNLGYTSALYLASPNTKILAYDHWNELLYANAIESIKSISRLKAKKAKLADSIKENARMFHDMGSINIILFADGEGYNEDDYTMINKLYGSHKNLCLHIVSFAENQENQEKLDIIAKKNPCSVSVHAEDLLKFDNLIEKFVRATLVTEINF